MSVDSMNTALSPGFSTLVPPKPPKASATPLPNEALLSSMRKPVRSTAVSPRFTSSNQSEVTAVELDMTSVMRSSGPLGYGTVSTVSEPGRSTVPLLASSPSLATSTFAPSGVNVTMSG